MNLKQRTGRNIAWIAVSDILVKGVNIVITVYLARVLGVDYFGIFSLAVAIVSTTWPIVDLGVSGFGTREVARAPGAAQHLLSSLNSMRAVASLAACLIAGGICYSIALSDTERLVILAAMLYLPGFALCPDWVFRGIERMALLGLMNATTAVALIMGMLWFVSGPDDVGAASLVRSLSFAFGSACGIFILARNRNIRFGFEFDLPTWAALARRMSAFLFNRIATNLGQFLPLFAISWLMADRYTGLFAAPHRLYIIALTGLAAITSAIYPVLSSLFLEDRDRFRDYQKRIVQLLLMLFLPLVGIGIVGSDLLIDVIFGDEYTESSPAFAVMLIALPVVALRSIYMLTLMAAGQEKYTFLAMQIALVCQAVAVIALINSLGIVGAALAMLAGELVAVALLIYVGTRRVGIYLPLDRCVLKVASIVALLVTMARLFDWQLVGIALIGAPTYLVLLVLFRALRIEELRGLLSRG